MSTTTLPPCHPAAELFPLLGDNELAELAEDIAKHGLRNPVVFMPDGKLLDGRNRHLACSIAGIEPDRITYEGDEPTAFVISENIHRRSLGPSQRAAIGVKALPYLEREGRKRKSEMARKGHDQTPEEDGADRPQPDEPKKRAPKSRDKAAAMTGASGRSVGRAKRIQEQAPDLFDPLLSGDLSLTAAEAQVKQRLEDKKSREERKDQMVAVPTSASGEGWWMFHGDFREKLTALPAESVDLLITDPPDPHAFLPMAPNLARSAERLLADGGICVVRTNLLFVHDVVRSMTQHLAWGWQYIEPAGSSTKIMPRQSRNGYHSWLAFSKGSWPVDKLDWHSDMLDPGDPAGQLIDALSRPVGTVLDPFAGEGSFGLAAVAAGRPFMGCEIDPQAFQKAVTALGKVSP